MKNNNALAAPWLLLTTICIFIILAGLIFALKKSAWQKTRTDKLFYGTIFSVLLWIITLSMLAQNGFFANFSKLPPRPALAMFLPLPVVLIIAFSKTGTKLLQLIPAQWMIWIQSFRIAVEVLLWMAYTANKMPVQMTFEGRNFDVITGLLAIPAGYLITKKIKQTSSVIIIFNIIGLILLLNVIIIAVLSMPTPLRYFMNEPAVAMVSQFPFIFLPGVLVPLAYTMHIFSLRKLLVHKK